LIIHLLTLVQLVKSALQQHYLTGDGKSLAQHFERFPAQLQHCSTATPFFSPPEFGFIHLLSLSSSGEYCSGATSIEQVKEIHQLNLQKW